MGLEGGSAGRAGECEVAVAVGGDGGGSVGGGVCSGVCGGRGHNGGKDGIVA